ncbi:hypothetical protein Vafri_15937 [Volvox africanus]|uniref:Uncharacterized protein n=1 Tax=Volvox africanus TaxID=51714 RepID=A0A8J4F659_9CHLO|nr:hypothetical protein Vafri_15937 [Volvox africanus]
MRDGQLSSNDNKPPTLYPNPLPRNFSTREAHLLRPRSGIHANTSRCKLQQLDKLGSNRRLSRQVQPVRHQGHQQLHVCRERDAGGQQLTPRCHHRQCRTPTASPPLLSRHCRRQRALQPPQWRLPPHSHRAIP